MSYKDNALHKYIYIVTYNNIVILKDVATPISARENEASVCISAKKIPQMTSMCCIEVLR